MISVANEYEKNIFLDLNNKSEIKIIRNGINLKNLSEYTTDFRSEI